MFGWMSRCWGGFGVNSQYERARVRSIITDWKVPDDNDLCILINSFKGQNPEIGYERALQIFFTHMQIDQQKSNPIFLLKHLYILDQTIQQRTALQKISSYQSSQFFSFKTGEDIQITPIRELVATYFIYIKKKAEVYRQIKQSFFSKKDERKKIIQNMEINEIFALIAMCFDIQKQINEINSKYKGRNKGAQLIQMVFAMLLKTYLFCYTIVSTCASILYKRVNELTKPYAVRMYKFIIYFNKDYTRNFVDFIESNKEIEIFKNIKYSEIILIQKSYVQYLQNHIKNIESKPAGLIAQNIVNNKEEQQIVSLPQDILSLLQDIKITYQPRKPFKIVPIKYSEKEFESYTNLYSNDYESEFETSVRNAYNSAQEANPDKSLSQSKLFKSKKIEYETRSSSIKFTEHTWNQWNNVYSS